MLGGRSRPRIKYQAGKLLLVCPCTDHGRAVVRLSSFLMSICTTLQVEIRRYGATLYRKPGFDHGVMPDLSYYVQNAKAVGHVRGKIDLTVNPPPDLVVEILISNGAPLATEVYRELGVPEVWLLDMNEAEQLSFTFAAPDPAPDGQRAGPSPSSTPPTCHRGSKRVTSATPPNPRE